MSTWRLIDTGACGAHYNMAVDEAISTSVRKGLSPATLRFFEWDKLSVSIGSSQRATDINEGYCEARSIPLVRRPTGGRAILHDDEFTYSFSSGLENGVFSGNLFADYRKLSGAFTMAFSMLGLQSDTVISKRAGQRSPICFQSPSYGEIVVRKRKIIGSAQRRWSDGLLQQGSVPYSIDYEKMQEVFSGAEGVSRDFMAGLREFVPDLAPEELKSAVVDSFQEVFRIRLAESTLSEEEESFTQKLLREKYLQHRWTYRR